MHFQESTCLYDLWMRLACNIDWFIRTTIISSTYFSLPTYVTALFSDLFLLSFLFSQTLAASRHEKLNYSINFTLYIFTLVHGSITQLLFEKKDAVQ